MPLDITHNGQTITVFERHEVDNASAAARRAAETERDTATARVAALEAQVSGSTQATQTLQQQIDALNASNATATKKVQGFKALVRKKVDPDLADFLLEHPSLADADFSTEDGITAVMTKVQPFLPKTDGTPPVVPPVTPPVVPPNSTGVVTPPTTKAGVPLTPEAIESMSQADILANKDAVLQCLAAEGGK